MGFIDGFSQATGIEVPDQIAGISVPSVDLADLDEQVGSLVATVTGFEDVVEKALAVRRATDDGVRVSTECSESLVAASAVLEGVRAKMEPLDPLFRCSPEAVAMLSQETLGQCIEVVGDVLDLGKLLEKMSLLLSGVQQVFQQIMEAAAPVLDAIKQYVEELASNFSEAACFDSALEGLSDLMAKLQELISELDGIRTSLGPIVEAWANASWLEAAAFGATNYEEIGAALQRFTPAWDLCQERYTAASTMGAAAKEQADKAQAAYQEVLKGLSSNLGVEIPGL